LTDLVSLQLLKDFFNSLGNCNFNSQTNLQILDFRTSYLSNISLYALELLNFVILLHVNARLEFPLLNLRLRKRFLKGNFLIYLFGLGLHYFTFPIKNCGSILTYLKLIYGCNFLCKFFIKIKQSKLFFGKALLKSSFFKIFFTTGNILRTILKCDNIIGSLENESGLIGAYDLGLFSSINRFSSSLNLNLN
jgi:NADH-quinone oxidoreductase subunit G